jgi:tetraacyldisaccharide 4'-kinase
MREPSLWWDAPGAEAALLAPIAAVYGAISGMRMRQSGRTVGIPVVCVGNLTVGGAGKTPAALAIAQVLMASGHRVFFLSRGYGGRLSGPVRIDPKSHRAADVGDEPLLLAQVAPTIVAHDRVAGAEMARVSGASVVVMDDGFQNPSLAKDFSVLVIDGRRGIGNGRVIPAGPLRAPLQAQLARAEALLVLGQPSDPTGAVMTEASARGIPIFRGRLEPDADTLAGLRGRSVLAFAGIGDPEKFFATLSEAGIPAHARAAFPDHYRYGQADAQALLGRAQREKLLLVTTEKDMARMRGDEGLTALVAAACALPVTLRINEQEAFTRLLAKKGVMSLP